LVREAIESVLAQTCTDFEIIVVDDGSKDDTAERLQPYRDRITYKKQNNQGLAAARNTGIRLAQGEFVCFLDDDDLWMPTKLEKQIQFADAHPEYALISTEIEGFGADNQPMGKSKSSMYEIRNGFVVEHLLFGNWIAPSTVMMRRTCLNEVGGFDEDIRAFAEDWVMWMRVASKFPVYFITEPLVRYRYHAGQMTQEPSEKQFRSLMVCLEKLSVLPQLRQKPQLLREAEYRICMERSWRDRESGQYERAISKLKRARQLRKFAITPLYQMLRTVAEKQFKREKGTYGR
jgi:GT2 family glycosyltransferase